MRAGRGAGVFALGLALFAAACRGVGRGGEVSAAATDLRRRARAAWEWIERGRAEAAGALLERDAREGVFFHSGAAGVAAGRAWQEALFALGRGEEVRAWSRDALAGEERPETLVLQARVVDDPVEQRRLLQRALDLDPSSVWALYGLGVLAARAGAYAAAAERFDRALDLDPGFSWARRARALVRDRLADFPGAASDDERALQQRPAAKDVLAHLASLEHRELGRSDRAEEHYRLLLDIEPRRADALLGLGACLQEGGRLAQAESLYLQLADREPLALFNLALLYEERMDRPKLALLALRRFLEGEPPPGSFAAQAVADRYVYAPLRLKQLERRLGRERGE